MKTVARWLRRIADRLDDSGGIRYASPFALAIEDGKGLVVREDGTGCPIVYVQHDHDRMYEPPAKLPPGHWAARTVSATTRGRG